MDLITAIAGERRSDLSFSDWANLILTGDGYGFSYPRQTLTGDKEKIPASFDGYVTGAYKDSPVVFACELIRMSVFSEARFMYRRLNKGRPGELFHTPSLNVLRRPSKGETSGEMMTRAILDVDLGGNHFAVRIGGNKIRRLRPDWMTIVLGSDREDDVDPVHDPDADVVGYLYFPGGDRYKEPLTYLPEDIAHWAPIPDPQANYRGMSWLTPVIREVQGDKQASKHKNRFYEKGATPNMIVKGQWVDPDLMSKWVKLFRSEYEGVSNAYKTLVLGSGMDAEVVGSNFQQLDFKALQGSAETRIAAASGVGAVMAQFSEGMEGSALNAGNYAAARRRVADAVFRPLWRSFCGAYENIVPTPRNAELWYDERDIAFLREDEKDAAEIQNLRATTVRQLVDAGFEAETVVDAIENDDFSLLAHSGLFSVQLQPPGTTTPDTVEVPDV